MIIKPIASSPKPKKERFKAYQCRVCEHLDIDDATDKVFCTAGFWPGCGDPQGCRAAFIHIEGKGRIGVHR